MRLFAQLEQLLGGFQPPRFRDAKEYQTIDGEWHGRIQIVRRDVRVAPGDMAGQRFPPPFDFFQESGILFPRSTFSLD